MKNMISALMGFLLFLCCGIGALASISDFHRVHDTASQVQQSQIRSIDRLDSI